LGGFIVGSIRDETISIASRIHHPDPHRLGHGGRAASTPDHRAFSMHEKRKPAFEESEATSNFSAPNFEPYCHYRCCCAE